jgi:GNAT superfamily N-acetyltransferase
VVVRAYRPDDEDACRALFAELVDAHRALYPGAQIGERFELAGETFVAEEDGRVVGYAGLLRHGRQAELEPIVVARDARRAGVGAALAAAAVERARAAGAIRVFVRPVARNRDAIAFFRSAGFDVLAYVQLQLDLDERERRAGETLAGVEFLV